MSARNYGDRVATLPAHMHLSEDEAVGLTVRPGADIAVRPRVFDGFDQQARRASVVTALSFSHNSLSHSNPFRTRCAARRLHERNVLGFAPPQVLENPKAVGSLACEALFAPGPGGGSAPPQPCGADAVIGQLTAIYRSGGVEFANVLVFGPPGTVYTLSVTISGVVFQLKFNVTVRQCSRLEAYDETARECACVENAVQVPPPKGVAWNAVGGCECSPGSHLSSDGRACLAGPAPPRAAAALPPWGAGVVAAGVFVCFCLACWGVILVASRLARHKAAESLVIAPSELRVVPSGARQGAGSVTGRHMAAGVATSPPRLARPSTSVSLSQAIREATAQDLLNDSCIVHLRGTRVSCVLLRLPSRGTLSDVVRSNSRIFNRVQPGPDEEESGYTPSLQGDSDGARSVDRRGGSELYLGGAGSAGSMVDSSTIESTGADSEGAGGGGGGAGSSGADASLRAPLPPPPRMAAGIHKGSSAPTLPLTVAIPESGGSSAAPTPASDAAEGADSSQRDSLGPLTPGSAATRAFLGTDPSLAPSTDSGGPGGPARTTFRATSSRADSSRRGSYTGEGSRSSATRSIGDRLRRISQRLRRQESVGSEMMQYVDRYSSRGGAFGSLPSCLALLAREYHFLFSAFALPPPLF